MGFLYFDRNIPAEAHRIIGELGPRGVAAFAFAPGGGWVIVTKDRAYYARGIADECFQQLGSFMRAGDELRVLAFTPSGGWVIVTDRHYYARGIADECFRKLGDFFAAGASITCIAFPPQGGNSWVILAGHALFARNIDDECYQLLCNCLPSTRPARKVAFTPGGGWAILAEDYYWARNIPGECFDQMGNFRQQGWLLDHLAFSAEGAWSLQTNTVAPARPADPIRDMENHITVENGVPQSIWQRMAKYRTPGASVAVVLENRLAWACSYGHLERGKPECVHTDTVFQAASISKPVAAVGFLRLVQDGHLQLSENLTPYLGWNLPLCSTASAKWKSQMNLALLLQHRGGVSGLGVPDASGACSNFGGFAGYANDASVAVPTLAQILAGAPPCNSPPIQISYQPGGGPYYSGAGYVLMMQMLEHLTGHAFRPWMREHVLLPAGMTRSSFEMTLPPSMSRAAAGHDANGEVIAGRRNRYPEAAAAGLYTTAADLCRFISLLNCRGTLDGREVLDQTRTAIMVNQATGIFTQNPFGADNFCYWHNGINYGFRALIKGFPNRRAGVAVMTNGERGDRLHNEIVQAVETHYGWN
ncbi:MAG: beta-lactamase family protein [Rhodocyclaceae bacterium]|nr:beta-lactamase family protein [Rhodocyclaceae bacterium]